MSIMSTKNINTTITRIYTYGNSGELLKEVIIEEIKETIEKEGD